MTAANKFNKMIESKNKRKKRHPLAFTLYRLEKIMDWIDNKSKPRWSEKRVEKFLNYVAPKRMYFDKQDNSFELEIINLNANVLANAAKRRDKKWAWYYKRDINNYFIEKFQVSGYQKTVEFWDDEQTTIVKFTKI